MGQRKLSQIYTAALQLGLSRPRVGQLTNKIYHNGRTTYRVRVGEEYYWCTPGEHAQLMRGETAADLELTPAPDEDEI